jgi:DNA-binding LacI/PurR family transcriptional regulator
MAGRAISIEDIAREVGVSHTTVSRALHNSPLISAEVRQRIQQAAQTMGYTPNAVAQSLQGLRTRTVGVVVTAIADPFVGRVVRGIEDVAQAANMSVFLSSSQNNPEREMAVIETFHRRRVDGVISAATRISGQYRERLARSKIPTVFINQQAEAAAAAAAEQLHFVDVDDYTGARQAVGHLLELGHRAIAYLGAGNRPWSNRRRLAGYLDAMHAAGITVSPAWIGVAPAEHGDHAEDVADGEALLSSVLPAGVTAAFCYNDAIAVGALLACRRLGLSVPQHLSVVGFDDIEMAQYVTPPLTTIHQPKLRLGQLAMQMLLEILEDRPVENQVLPTQLIRRASTGPVLGGSPEPGFSPSPAVELSPSSQKP